MAGTRNLGTLVVRLALELAQYRREWGEAEQATSQGAARVEKSTSAAAQAVGKLVDVAKAEAGAAGEAAGQIGGLATQTQALTGISGGAAIGLGAVAAALAAVGVAAYKGHQDQKALNDALLLTGNYAGVVSGQLDQMALKVASSVNGTVGSAREVLGGLVASGRFTVESMGEVAEAVMLVARFSGESEKEVLKHFAGMADGVTKWAEKTNQAYHFLDLQTYRYIKQLEEQGRVQEAARVTSEKLAQHLGGDLTQNLGFVEKAWHKIKAAASGAWEAMKGIGKDQSNADKLAELDAYIEKSRNGLMGRSAGGQQQLLLLQQQADQLRALVDAERLEAQVKSERGQATEKAIESDKKWAKVLEDTATKADQMNKKLAEARELAAEQRKNAGDNAAAIAKINAELAKAEASIRERYTEKGSKKADPYANLILQTEQRIAVLKLEEEATSKLTASEKIRAQYLAAVAEGYKPATKAVHEARLAKLAEAEAIEKAIQARALEKKEALEAAKAYGELIDASEKNIARLREEIEKQQLHNASLGKSKEAIAELAVAKLEEKAADLEWRANWAENIVQDEKLAAVWREQAQALRDLAKVKREGAAAEDRLKSLKDDTKEWKKFVDDMDNTFRDGFGKMLDQGHEGFKAWTKGLARTAKIELADELYKMFAKPFILNVLANVTGSSALATMAQQAGGSNMLSSIGSNLLSKFMPNSSFGGSLMGEIANGTFFGNVTAGMQGFGGSFASTVGQGLATDAMGATVAEGASGATLGAGSEIGGMMSTLGPFMAILAPIFAAFAAGFFDGEERKGASFASSFDGQRVWNPRKGRWDAAEGVGAQFLEGPSGGAGDVDATKALINATTAGFNDALSVLGTGLTLKGFQAGWETSPLHGAGGVFAGGTLSDGRTFGESGQGAIEGKTPFDNTYEFWSNFGTEDAAADFKNFGLDLKQSILEGFQVVAGAGPEVRLKELTEAQKQLVETFKNNPGGEDGDFSANKEIYEQGFQRVMGEAWERVFDEASLAAADAAGVLPKKIWDKLRGQDFESKSEAEVDAVLGSINTMIANVKAFDAMLSAFPGEKFKKYSFDAKEGLVALMGGVEAFAASMSTYAAEFFTESERRQVAVKNLAATLSEAGVTMTEAQLSAMASAGDARAQYRALVEAQDENTEAGLKAQAALIRVAGAFAALTQQAGTLAGQQEADWIRVSELRAQRLADAARFKEEAEAKAALKDEVKQLREEFLLAGQAAAALNQQMRLSTATRSDQFAVERALAARSLADEASAKALRVQNVGQVLEDLSLVSRELVPHIATGITQAIVDASGGQNVAVRDAVSGFGATMAEQQVRDLYGARGNGLASVIAAQQSLDWTKVSGFGGGTWQMGADVVAYGKALDGLNYQLAQGKITAAEYEGALGELNRIAPGAAEYLGNTAAQLQRIQGAAYNLGQTGLESISYYFGDLTRMSQQLAAAAAEASEPIAQTTAAIGRLNSMSTAFGASAAAVRSGFSQAADGGGAVGEQAAAALARELQAGSMTSRATLIAESARIAAAAMTTADAAAAAEKLAASEAFKGLTDEKIRDAALMLDGVGQFNSVGFENAFTRISAALGENRITEDQYRALFATAMDMFEGVDEEAERTKSAFESLRDAMKGFADELIVDKARTPLSRGQRMGELQRQYDQALLRVTSGDVTAAGRVRELAMDILDKSQYRSRGDYNAAFSRIYRDARALEATAALAASGDEKVAAEVRNLQKLVAELDSTMTNLMSRTVTVQEKVERHLARMNALGLKTKPVETTP